MSMSLFRILSHLADHIYKHTMKFQSPLQSLRKKPQLCRTDRNRNANQSGSSRWYVWKANFFPLLSFIDFTPPSQWLWVIVRWANVPTCCSSSPFICLYPFFLLSRRLVKLLEQLLNFSASCCWTFSPLCHLSNYPLWFSWDLNIQA